MGGGTSSKTSTSSEFPPEFRPLAEGAVRQLLQLQGHLPIAGFADFQPAGTAGIAPMQQYAMDYLVPATMQTTPGQQGALNTQAPVNMASFGAAGSGQSTNAAQSALDALRASGRLGGGSVALPGGQSQEAFGAFLPPVQSAPTAFPGVTPEMMAQAWPQASRGSVPVISGPGPTAINPGAPTPEGFFPPPFDAHIDQATIWFKANLTGREGKAFDALVAGGMDPQKAFETVRGTHVVLGGEGAAAGAGAGGAGKKSAAPPWSPDLQTGSN